MSAKLPVVGIAGFGTMGRGIAQVVISAGSKLVVYDSTEGSYESGRALLKSSLDSDVDQGRISESAATESMTRVTKSRDLAGLAECDLVIEAVPEDERIKEALLSEIGRAVSVQAVIATTTSSLSITELAAFVDSPIRFAGLHFFNPAPLVPLVEIVPGLLTRQKVIELLSAWVTQMGKESIVVKDRPGFLVSSLWIPYLNQAIQEYDDGLATADDLDRAIRLGLGYPEGPLEVLDRIGLDTHLMASNVTYHDTADSRYAPPPLLRRLVASGRLGKKSGIGIQPTKGEA